MRKTIFLYLVVLLLLWNAQLDAASFQGLGYLPDKDWASHARAVSADGSVVVGLCKSYSFQWEAFRWTASGGMQGLGYLPNDSYWSEARGVSADGSVVIGTVEHDFPSHSGYEAFRWTESGGMVGLGWLSTNHQSQGFDVSADGSVVVGVSMNTSGYEEAFRWTESGGMVGLGDLPGSDFHSWAYSVSDNGSVVVGYSPSALGTEAFRWTESGGMQGLGLLPGGINTKAYAVSGDGSVVVGRAHMGTYVDCFRWTQSEGMISLGGGDAYAVSYDGSVVVGTSFIWDERYGRQHLWDWLENVFGLDLTGWTIGGARGISPDGLTIVGSGINPSGQYEAWIAVIDPVVNVPDVTGMAPTDAESAIISAELTVGDITHEYSDTVPKGYVTSQNPAASAWAPINSEVDIVISLGQLVSSIIYVDDDAPVGGDGMSWETAFINLQDALSAAESTDGNVNEIQVAEGVYKPDRDFINPNGSGNRSATFGLINGVVIKGSYAGLGEPDSNARDIVVYETILSGDLNDNDVGNLDDPSRDENSYHVVTGSQTDPNTVLDGFTITAGKANGVRSGTDGAGMYNYEGSPTLIDCTFSANLAVRNGAGMHNSYGSPVVINCVFRNNSAGNRGGGIYCYWSDATLSNCIFSGNLAPYGGGVRTYFSDSILTNCTFSSNSATLGGGVYNYEGNPTLTNCILWGDTPEEIYVSSGTPVVTYSDVQGGFSGVGNINVDPCFADSNSGDYHLKSEGWRWDSERQRWTYDDVTSRCIDAGNPGSPLADEPMSVPDDPCNIWGENIRINMGAYGGTIEASMPPYDWALLGDLTNNGIVNFVDFAAAASDWQKAVEQQPGDLDRNGLVNIADIALLTQDWLVKTSWYEPLIVVWKPNIYMYPEETTELHVAIVFPHGGRVTTSVPEYDDGWHITIEPSGIIDGQYEFLFYESLQPDYGQYEAGWVVAQDQLEGFFSSNMALTGFNQKEINDFIEYWIPRLTEYPYYALCPQYNEELEEMIRLEFSEQPANLIRLIYSIRGLKDSNVNLQEPILPPFARDGFTVAEWGVILK